MSYTLHRGAEADLAEAARFYRNEGGARLANRFIDGRLRILVIRHQRRDPAHGDDRLP